MDEPFRVLRYESPPDAKCSIEVDNYVPLRFRTYERPLGSNYLRLGDQETSLVELLVDPMLGLLRGVTITSFPAVSPWPRIEAREISRGLPVLAVTWGKTNRIDSDLNFSVSIRDGEVLVYWQALDRCEASAFQDRAHFLTVDGYLSGVRFSELGRDEVMTLTSHALVP